METENQDIFELSFDRAWRLAVLLALAAFLAMGAQTGRSDGTADPPPPVPAAMASGAPRCDPGV